MSDRPQRRDQAFDDAADRFRDGDPEPLQRLVTDNAQEALGHRQGADRYRELAQEFLNDAGAPSSPPAGDPHHRHFTDLPPTSETTGFGSWQKLSNPMLGDDAHLHAEFGVSHGHPGGSLPHGHPEAVFEQAGFHRQHGTVPRPEPASAPATAPEPPAPSIPAADAGTLGEAMVNGASIGTTMTLPLILAGPAGWIGMGLGAAVGAGIAGWTWHRSRSRPVAGPAAAAGSGALVAAALMAGLYAPDPAASEFQFGYVESAPARQVSHSPADSGFRAEDDCNGLRLQFSEYWAQAGDPGRGFPPATGCPFGNRGRNPVLESARDKYRVPMDGVTQDRKPCTIGMPAPVACYHKTADGGPDLLRGVTNEITRGGEQVGRDAAGRPCVVGLAPDCEAHAPDPLDGAQPEQPAAPGLLEGLQRVAAPLLENVGQLAAGPAPPVLGLDSEGNACYVGEANPDCRPRTEEVAQAPGLFPETPEPFPTALLPPGAQPGNGLLGDCPTLQDCMPSLPSGPGGPGGPGSAPVRSGNLLQGRPNPGNIEVVNVLMPSSDVNGCRFASNNSPCYDSMGDLEAAVRATGWTAGGPLYVCPGIDRFRHTPPHPVLQTQAEAAGRTAQQVALYLDHTDGKVVTWSTNLQGNLEFDVMPDPVALVSVRKQLSPETIHWIERGEVQQRYPGSQVRNADVCFVKEVPAAGRPLHAWHPADPGVHQVTRAQLMTRAGTVVTETAPPPVYEFNVALSIASADQ